MAPVNHRSSSLLGSTTRTVALATTTLALVILAQAPTTVNAHIRMNSPPPLRGETNPQYSWDSYDYSMTNPLELDGSNFACKGFHTDVPNKSQAVETIKAGQQYQVSLDGSATHGGGSCQFALSYDGGQSFGVIHSVIGGCPIAKNYPFKIPDNVPSGKNVLLSWTWFNKVGNREMYMNCAALNIESSSTAALTLPGIFRANTFGPSCRTVEGDELVFPNPGDSVVYGGMWAGKKPGKGDLKVDGCSSDQTADKSVTLKSNTGAAPGFGNDKPAPPPVVEEPLKTPRPTAEEPVKTPQPTVEAPVVVVPSPSATKSSTVGLAPVRGGAGNPKTKTVTVTGSTPVATTTSSSLSSSSEPVKASPSMTSSKFSSTRQEAPTKASSAPVVEETTGGLCSGSGLKCSADGGSFSVCADGRWISMGLVAAGTTCKNGKIDHAHDAAPESCTPGSLICSGDGTSFSVCNTDGTSSTRMGLVAPGTLCQNGKIAAFALRKGRNATRNVKRHGYGAGPRRLNHSS